MALRFRRRSRSELAIKLFCGCGRDEFDDRRLWGFARILERRIHS
jgi:hypothetical protein